MINVFKPLLLGAAVVGCLFAPMSTQADYEPTIRDAVPFTTRDGLPNFFQKLKSSEKVSIAYFGGSITAQNGWRVLSYEWFKEQYPDAQITAIPAAIGGTGSDLGVFRLDKDVLAKKPDLVFVEFAVNDAGATPERILKAMEGIVRKIWAYDAGIDICFVYTMTFRESPQLAAGKMKRSESVMEDIADHYGIPSVHLGLKVAQLEQADKLVMKTDAPLTRVSGDELNKAAELATDAKGRILFSSDGVHPFPETGHVLYMEALAAAMQQFVGSSVAGSHRLKEPLCADNWQEASQSPIKESYLSGPYENLTRTGDPINSSFGYRMGRPNFRLAPGASLKFRFVGSKVALYDLLGPDGALLDISVDGVSRKKVRMDGYCTYHRLATLDVADGLAPDQEHEIIITVLDEPVDKREVLFERNRADLEANPDKYAPRHWYVGSIFTIGDVVE